MSKSLITENDFFKAFYHQGQYCFNDTYWPSSTILLYRIRIKNPITKADECLHQTGLCSLQFERWMKIVNEDGRHAEILFVKKLNHLLNSKLLPVTATQFSIDLVLSYTPCSECGACLIALKQCIENHRNRDGVAMFCDITTKFSNFYKIYDLRNIENLIEMVRNQVQMVVFNGLCDWKDFLDNIVKLPIDVQSEQFFDAFKVRQDRELVDSIILDCMKKAAITWVILERAVKESLVLKIRRITSSSKPMVCLHVIREFEEERLSIIQQTLKKLNL